MPKQYLPLLGLPLIAHTLQALLAVPELCRITVALSPDDTQFTRRAAPHFTAARVQQRLQIAYCGGMTRAETVSQALDTLAHVACEEDWVLVHDAARPCIQPDCIVRLMNTLHDDPLGGLLALPLADTLKRSLRGACAPQAGDLPQGEPPLLGVRVAETLPRDGLWLAQTPQMFRYGPLQKALRHAAAQGLALTDEASALEALGYHPQLVPGGSDNLKVTYPVDLTLAAAILHGRTLPPACTP